MTDLEPTRLSLHAVAELLVAGPQKRESDTVRLRYVPGGFATVKTPEASVVNGDLVTESASIALDGQTVADVAAAAGITPSDLREFHRDYTAFTPESVLTVDPEAAAVLEEAWRVGVDALTAFAPEAELVLWPEHFDVAVAVDEVTYGVSPGDDSIGVPYAYVSPFTKDGLDDPFFNQPFGAATPLTDIGDTTAVTAFFMRGRALTGQR